MTGKTGFLVAGTMRDALDAARFDYYWSRSPHPSKVLFDTPHGHTVAPVADARSLEGLPSDRVVYLGYDWRRDPEMINVIVAAHRRGCVVINIHPQDDAKPLYAPVVRFNFKREVIE